MDPKSLELACPLQILPPVEFCCAYGSSLLSNNNDKTSMVDYILGVVDPIQWHSENLERNRHHYSKRMSGFGPKAVHILVDNWDIRKVNLVNLKSATAVALLLLPPEFSEEDLYAKICSLSYMGDLRMLFAEDKSKVKKIVQGNFQSFRSMYKPMIQEYAVEGLLTSHFNAQHVSFKQDYYCLSATSLLFSSLPWIIQRQMAPKLPLKHQSIEMSTVTHQIRICREEAANCVRKVLRRKVMVSSARQAVAGALAAGGVNAARYLVKKMSKAWKSRASPSSCDKSRFL